MVSYTLYYIYIYICCSRCNRIVVPGVILRLPLDYRYDYTNTSITSISSARKMSLRDNPPCEVRYTRKWSSSCSLVLIIIIVTSGNRHYLLALSFVGVYRSSSRFHTMVQYRIRGGTSTLKVKPTIQMPFCC